MKYRNKNFGKSPFVPDYIQDYNPEEDYERYIDEQEWKFEYEREND